MRPTLRAVMLFAGGVPFALALMLSAPESWPLALAYLGAAVTLVGYDGLRMVRPGALRIEGTVPDMLYIGATDDLVAEIDVDAGWPAAELEYVAEVDADMVDAPGPMRAPLYPGRTTWITVPLRPTRRGEATVHRLWLRWWSPLRLVTRTFVETVDTVVRVIPNTRAVREQAVRFQSMDALFGFKPQAQQGDGTEFEALRDYVPGLDHRSIDWKRSARHMDLLCKEFRTERNHQIILAFDTGQLMAEPLDGIPKLDHAINAGLLMGYMSLRAGDRVGLYGFDAQMRLAAEPVSGVQRFGHLQRASARLEYHHEETNYTLGLMELLARLDRRTLVILMTEFVDTVTAELMVENIERVAARHLVVFVAMTDPLLEGMVDALPDSQATMTEAVIADDFLRDRAVVFERLRRAGVHVIEAPAERIGVDLVNRYLTIKRRELI